MPLPHFAIDFHSCFRFIQSFEIHFHPFKLLEIMQVIIHPKMDCVILSITTSSHTRFDNKSSPLISSILSFRSILISQRNCHPDCLQLLKMLQQIWMLFPFFLTIFGKCCHNYKQVTCLSNLADNIAVRWPFCRYLICCDWFDYCGRGIRFEQVWQQLIANRAYFRLPVWHVKSESETDFTYPSQCMAYHFLHSFLKVNSRALSPAISLPLFQPAYFHHSFISHCPSLCLCLCKYVMRSQTSAAAVSTFFSKNVTLPILLTGGPILLLFMAALIDVLYLHYLPNVTPLLTYS